MLAVVAAGAAAAVTLTGGNPPPPVAASDVKANCITLKLQDGVLNQSVINAESNVTGVSYNCVNTFANPVPAWAGWQDPWMFSDSSKGWDAWLAASSSHQVVMGLDLIPESVSDANNPLTWEQPCAAGSFNHYATTLAQNLVRYGAGRTVIRLGLEANGSWEADFVGTTSAEMSAWAKCYDNEVTAMRAVPGAHFLFVWNPNICTADLPLNQWYPGNAYVDIVGIDAYDLDCATHKTVAEEGWAAYSTDSAANRPDNPEFPSLVNIESFATAHGKPLSFPEWGLTSGTSDDAGYVTDMGQAFSGGEYSFETYFDTAGDGIAPLGTAIPDATAAYTHAFN